MLIDVVGGHQAEVNLFIFIGWGGVPWEQVIIIYTILLNYNFNTDFLKI
jgi:hypothetical protein